MTPEEFEKKMEDLKTPPATVQRPVDVKLAVLNARRSAVMGIWFIAVPYFFLACVLMKYLFHLHWTFLSTFEEMMASLDKDPGSRWIQPVLLVGLPIVGIVINLLSIMHFKWEKESHTLVISMKMRWLNLLILTATFMVVAIFVLYVFIENIHHAP